MDALAGDSDRSPFPYEPRQGERRRALGELLGALTRGLDRKKDVSLIRGVFEQMVRRIVPVRSIQLRENTHRWTSTTDGATDAESIVLDVPGSDPAAQGVSKAILDPGCRLGEWDFQMLGLAAHVGALVLEIERGRSRLARAGLSG